MEAVSSSFMLQIRIWGIQHFQLNYSFSHIFVFLSHSKNISVATLLNHGRNYALRSILVSSPDSCNSVLGASNFLKSWFGSKQICDAKSHFHWWMFNLNSKLCKIISRFYSISARRHLKIFQSKLRHFRILPKPTNRIQQYWTGIVNMSCTSTIQAFTRDSFTNYKNIY